MFMLHSLLVIPFPNVHAFMRRDPKRTGRLGSLKDATRRADGTDVGPRDDLLGSLKPTQQLLMRFYHTRGTWGFVLIVTIASVLMSIGVTTVILLASLFLDDSGWALFWVGLATSTVVPLIVAPIISFLLPDLLAALTDSYDRVHRLSIADPLTGVLNRRGFFEALDELLDTREAADIRIGMVDLDEFKHLNDRHGHDVGDRMLVEVAAHIVYEVGLHGVVGRIGGDEFAFAVAGTPSGLDDLTERVVEQCRVVEVAPGMTAGASVRVSTLLSSETVDTALGRADSSLYRSKVRRSQDGLDSAG
jgi:diguanylate cyclase (GGDEF)-like protein